MENQYLAFVDEIGRTPDGKFLYRFDYTEDTDVVWGEYFNIVPSVIVPNLQPDINCLSYSENITCEQPLMVAKKNGCYSMQDCIDGTIALCFSEIDENTIYYEDVPLYFNFGEDFESVQNKIKICGFVSDGVKEVIKGSDEIIDNLIDSLGNENDNKDGE